MPIPVSDVVAESSDLAGVKAAQARHLPRYLVSSMLAGAYVGVAVVLLLSVAGPLAAAGSPFTRLVQGSVFGVALTLIVFAGAELFTGNTMVMLHGAWRGDVRLRELLLVWAASLGGNVLGSLAFAALVHATGTLTGAGAPAARLLAGSLAAKSAATGPQLFTRAVLCNMLVCLGLWMAARTRSDGAKLVVLWWALLAFVGSGFEHSVANVTLFALGALDGTAAWTELGRNLLWTVPGNVVGGAVLVGAAYAYVAGARGAAPLPQRPAVAPEHVTVAARAGRAS